MLHKGCLGFVRGNGVHFIFSIKNYGCLVEAVLVLCKMRIVVVKNIFQLYVVAKVFNVFSYLINFSQTVLNVMFCLFQKIVKYGVNLKLNVILKGIIKCINSCK